MAVSARPRHQRVTSAGSGRTSNASPSNRSPSNNHSPSGDGRIFLPRWQPNAEVSRCPVCNCLFTFVFRKHHCRKCGKVVCASCSQHRITIPRQFVVQPPAPAAPGSSLVSLLSGGDTSVFSSSKHKAARQQNDAVFAANSTSSSASPTSPAVPGSAGADLSGAETVRVCNPCVPDPNLSPPPQQYQHRFIPSHGHPTASDLRLESSPLYPVPGQRLRHPSSTSESQERGAAAGPPLSSQRLSPDSEQSPYWRSGHSRSRSEAATQAAAAHEASVSRLMPIRRTTLASSTAEAASQPNASPTGHRPLSSRNPMLDYRYPPLTPQRAYTSTADYSSAHPSAAAPSAPATTAFMSNHPAISPLQATHALPGPSVSVESPAVPPVTGRRPYRSGPASSTNPTGRAPAPAPAPVPARASVSRRPVSEEDECPVCGLELPLRGPDGNEDDRVRHVEECLVIYSSSLSSSVPPIGRTATSTAVASSSTPHTPAPIAAGQSVSPPSIHHAAHAGPLSYSTASASSFSPASAGASVSTIASTPGSSASAARSAVSTPTPAATPASGAGPGVGLGMRPRRATGSRMLVYHATEKDCMAVDGETQECVICFEEFEEGNEMGRLECLCKFHLACIRQWWETKGTGSCPTHQLHQ